MTLSAVLSVISLLATEALIGHCHLNHCLGVTDVYRVRPPPRRRPHRRARRRPSWRAPVPIRQRRSLPCARPVRRRPPLDHPQYQSPTTPHSGPPERRASSHLSCQLFLGCAAVGRPLGRWVIGTGRHQIVPALFAPPMEPNAVRPPRPVVGIGDAGRAAAV